MYPKNPGHPATTCLKGNHPHQPPFEVLLEELTPFIKRYAGRYPPKFEDDFFQEGALALYDVHQKFFLSPLRDFRQYAMKSIKNRMRNYYKKIVLRSPVTEELTITYNDCELNNDLEYNPTIKGAPEYSTDETFDLDYSIIFTEKNLAAFDFTEKEIKVFTLYVTHGYAVNEIATELVISDGRASQLLASVRKKSNSLWNLYNLESKKQ